jgi:regulator of replication initiation timing
MVNNISTFSFHDDVTLTRQKSEAKPDDQVGSFVIANNTQTHTHVFYTGILICNNLYTRYFNHDDDSMYCYLR